MDTSESETSDEEIGLQKKALDVSLPDDFDPNSIPQTGEEYLQHVIYERTKKCKKCVTANGDFTKFNKNQTIVVEANDQVFKALDKFYPSKQWQEEALKDFIQFRNFITNTDKPDPILEDFNAEDFIKTIECSHPKFSEVTKYSQATKLKMLKTITKHLDSLDSSEGVGESLGSWIYAILALLEKPLSPDCCFKLREFAKKCAKVRADLGEDVNEDVAVPFNLYICLIARYFNQLDLADK